MVCGEEMRLVQTVRDDTMIMPGFEYHILKCPYCNDEEQRLEFIDPPEALSISRNTHTATSSVWDRAAGWHRARWRALYDRLGLRLAGKKAEVSGEE
jgi:hypothetical protein